MGTIFAPSHRGLVSSSIFNKNLATTHIGCYIIAVIKKNIKNNS